MSIDWRAVLGLLLIVVTVGFAVVRTVREQSDDALRREGRVALAQIVRVTNTGVNKRHGAEVVVDVRFEVDGQPRLASFTETATVSLIPRLRTGALVEIVYDAAKPQHVALRAQ